MSNLVITMIGIALFVAISAGGLSYININAVEDTKNQELVKSGFVKLISEYHVYKINNNEPMSMVSDWTNEVDKPSTPHSTDWKYKTTIEGNYFCLTGEISDKDFLLQTSRLLNKNFNSAFTNNICGSTIDDKTFNKGDIKSFTIWLDSNYENIQ